MLELLQQPEVRLLTLTGPGGVGKTRLGVQVATELAGAFADGVYFVSLAPIRDHELVISTAAQTLGLREAGERPLLERLKGHLQDKQLLLLLDNFEHVVAAAPLLTGLLVACPRLKVLVTSRAVLHLSGEHEFPVPPLELPDPEHLPETESLSRYPAAALFLQRMLATKPDFKLTAANAPAVAEICARLDGLPLAIELAAARGKLLPPQAMLARLEHRLHLLTGGARDLPDRQQTLRSAVGWSYDLLDERERRLFRRLSVFAGGATLEAVEAVCDASGEPSMNGLDASASLIDKSLLRQVEQADGEPRLTMLETIREYALEQLTVSGEEESIRRSHADYYLALAEAAEPNFTTAAQAAWSQKLEAEHDNLRAAFSWLLERGDAERALRLGVALRRFWYLRCYLSEGRRWLKEALALGGEELAALRAKALNGAGHLAWCQGDFERAVTLREESLRLSRQLGDKAEVAASLNGLSFVFRMKGRYEEARAMCEEALAIYRELKDRWGTAESLLLSGATAAFQGDYETARPALEEGVALFREIGDWQGVADSLGPLAMVTLARGDYAAARSLIEESQANMKSAGDRRGLAKTFNVMGEIVLNEGDYGAARALYEQALVVSRDLNDKWWIAWELEGLAGVAAAQEQPFRAVRLFGAAEALREAIGAPRPPAHRPDQERRLAAARAQLDAATFAKAWDEGRAMTPEQALAQKEPASPLKRVGEVREPSKLPPSPIYSAGLTSREAEVLRLVARGMTNGQVAGELFISPRTVDTHLTSIYSKLGVSSRSAATRYAVDRNLA